MPSVAAPKLVTRIEVLGSGERIVTLEDASGQVVYRSDPIRQETVISRGSPVPSGEPPAPSVPALGSADPFAAEFGAPAPGDAEAANKLPRGWSVFRRTGLAWLCAALRDQVATRPSLFTGSKTRQTEESGAFSDYE